MNLSLDFSTEFVLASLRLGKHVDGLIDSYFGPSELSDTVSREPQKPLSDILLEIDMLRKRINSWVSDKYRRTYMEKQLGALRTITLQKMGNEIPYREFVSKTLDVEAKQVKEKELSKTRDELQELLKKSQHQGDLTEKITSFERMNLVSGETLARQFSNLMDAARGKTRARISLAPSELAELRIVSDKPWKAYNWYLGSYKSRIDLNADLPTTSTVLPHLVAHEAYPGHHTEHTSKEQELYINKKQLESSVLLVNTPDCTMTEGLADTAGKFILGETNAVNDRIQQLITKLREAVNVNVALMIHDKGIDLESTKKYYQEMAGVRKDEVDKHMSFILDPLWRGYIFSYYEGAKLIEEAWKKAIQEKKEQNLLHILYKEENCPTTFKQKIK
jgi:hypothetical protein